MQRLIDMTQLIQGVRRSHGVYLSRRFDGSDPLFTQLEKNLIQWVKQDPAQIFRAHENYAFHVKDTLPFLVLLAEFKNYRLLREMLIPLVDAARAKRPESWKEADFQIKTFKALFGSLTPFDACFSTLQSDYPTQILRRQGIELIFGTLDLLTEVFDQVPGFHVALLASLFKYGKMEDAKVFLELYAHHIDFLYVSWEGRVQTFVHFVIRHCPFALELLQYGISQVTKRLDEFTASDAEPHEQNSVFLKRDSDMNDPFSVAALLDCPDVFEYLAERMEQTTSTVRLLLSHPSARNPIELAVRQGSVNVVHFLAVRLRRNYSGVIGGMAAAFLDTRFADDMDQECYLIRKIKGLSGAPLFTAVLFKHLPAMRKLSYFALRPGPRRSFEKPSACTKIIQTFEQSIESIERSFAGGIALLSPSQFDHFVGNIVSHYLKARDMRVFAEAIGRSDPVKKNILIAHSLEMNNTLPPLPEQRDLELLNLFYGSHKTLIASVMEHLRDGDDEFVSSLFGSFEGYVVHLLERCKDQPFFVKAMQSVINYILQSEEVDPFLVSIAYQLLDFVTLSEERVDLRAQLVKRVTPLMEALAPLNNVERERKLRYASEVALTEYVFAPTSLDTPEKVRALWEEAMKVELPKRRTVADVLESRAEDDSEDYSSSVNPIEEDEETIAARKAAEEEERISAEAHKARAIALREKITGKKLTVFTTTFTPKRC